MKKKKKQQPIFFQSVKIVSSPSQKKFIIDNYNYKKSKFVNSLIDYLNNFNNEYKSKRCKNNNMVNMSKKTIQMLSNLSYINEETEVIEGYSKVDSNPCVNISINAFRGFPKDPPRIIYFLGLIGIWYLIDMKNTKCLSEGNISDINNSLLIIQDTIDKKIETQSFENEYNFINELKEFFKEITKEKFVEIKLSSE